MFDKCLISSSNALIISCHKCGQPLQATTTTTTTKVFDYILKTSGNCSDDGYETIMDVGDCLSAGRAYTGDPTKMFAADMPAGGYADSTEMRTRGCTYSGQSLQLFPNALGTCGTPKLSASVNFVCLCRRLKAACLVVHPCQVFWISKSHMGPHGFLITWCVLLRLPSQNL